MQRKLWCVCLLIKNNLLTITMKKTFEISIPTEWCDVSIAKFTKYMKAIKDVEDPQELMTSTISELCDLHPDVVKVMKLSDIKQIYNSLQKLISKQVNQEIITKIKIGSITYGWHSKLDDLTMGEFADIETFANEDDSLAKMMSVLYRPISKEQGNRYDIEPYDSNVHHDNWHKFKKLSIDAGNPVAVFFWTLGIQQLNNFHQSSKGKEEKV